MIVLSTQDIQTTFLCILMLNHKKCENNMNWQKQLFLEHKQFPKTTYVRLQQYIIWMLNQFIFFKWYNLAPCTAQVQFSTTKPICLLPQQFF